jgi:capsular polysaccharide biosynthesis protein
MKKEFTFIDLIQLILKKKLLFILIGSSVFVISIIISFQLTVYYKSTCILYPFNPEAYDPRNIDKATTPYGTGFDGDRIMALAESREIQKYIIDKYYLTERYKIDKNDVMADIKVREQFAGNLTISENQFSAIEISLLDVNADTAALIVNDMVAKIDDLNKKPLVDMNTKIFESYEKVILEKYNGIDSIQKLVRALNKNSKESRSDYFTLETIKTITDLNTARKSLELIKNNFSTLNIIQPAEAIYKKAYPKRLNIVLISVFASLFLTFLFVLTVELYKRASALEDSNN